jgi:glycosyltransferase involved in cell wall biosynthesis
VTKVLSIVTLVSPQGEYGGPVRVAVNQAAALAERGHSVTIVGATRGFDTVPEELEGTPCVLFPAKTLLPGLGFAGLTAPSMIPWLRKHVGEFDVVHIHLARDLVTLPAAEITRRNGSPYVLQTHGMIDRSPRRLAAILDRGLTKRVLRDAKRVLYLTRPERRELEYVAGRPLALDELPNGVPFQAADTRPGPGPSEVLYLARLAPRKRPALFVEVATRLAREFPDVSFRLVGPDEGEGTRVSQLIETSGIGSRIEWEGALPPDATLNRMRRSVIYVLPAVDEPYPMSVLEAMSVGLPVVVTDTCGLAGFVQEHSAGIVVGEDTESLYDGVRRLLEDPIQSAETGVRGREAVRRELSMGAIAQRLEGIYSS